MSEESKEPAFPRNYSADGHNGMTLRDYFAAQAMQGFIIRNDCSYTEIIKGAYGFADGMLEEREK